MKLFEVKEIRSYYATYRILAENEEQAGQLKGDIQEETHSDCWGVRVSFWVGGVTIRVERGIGYHPTLSKDNETS